MSRSTSPSATACSSDRHGYAMTMSRTAPNRATPSAAHGDRRRNRRIVRHGRPVLDARTHGPAAAGGGPTSCGRVPAAAKVANDFGVRQVGVVVSDGQGHRRDRDRDRLGPGRIGAALDEGMRITGSPGPGAAPPPKGTTASVSELHGSGRADLALRASRPLHRLRHAAVVDRGLGRSKALAWVGAFSTDGCDRV